MKRQFFFAWMIATCTPGMALAQECAHYGGYTHWTGSLDFQNGSQIVDMAISGNIAYCLMKLSNGQGMVRVVNVENLSTPLTLGSVAWANGQPGSIVLSGSKVYVTDGTGGLRIVDVSNPASPTLEGQVAAPNASSADVAVSGSFAFLADTNQGLHIVDISNPQTPSITGGVDTPGSALGIAVVGSVVYIADYALSGLQIVDVSNKNSPAIIGSVATPGPAFDVTISGSFAYVADGDRGVQIINIFNTNSPAIVSNIPVPLGSEVLGVTFMGSRAFLACGHQEVYAYDVSNPSLPSYVNSLRTTGRCQKVVHSEGSLVFALYAIPIFPNSSQGGFDAFYISVQSGTPVLDTLTELTFPQGIAVSGPIACLATWYSGLVVVDVSNPESAQILGTLATTAAYDVALSGSTAYIAAGYEGLKLVDVSDPSQPTLITTVPLSTIYETGAVRVVGSTAYVANYGAGLRVLDVSNPSQPSIIGNLLIPTSNLTVSGTYVYLANGVRVVIVDVSNPASPIEIGGVFLTSKVLDIAVHGSILYVGTENGVAVVDASNPSVPLFVTELPMGDHVHVLSVFGSFLYVGTRLPGGLIIADVSEPMPRMVGNVSGLVSSMTTSGDFIYLGTEFGFSIAPVQCEATTGITPEPSTISGVLGAAHPNPFRGTSALPFALTQRGMVTMRVYDLAGREVRTLLNEPMVEGSHNAIWDGRNDAGTELPAGIYFFQLQAPGIRASQKVVRIQ